MKTHIKKKQILEKITIPQNTFTASLIINNKEP